MIWSFSSRLPGWPHLVFMAGNGLAPVVPWNPMAVRDPVNGGLPSRADSGSGSAPSGGGLSRRTFLRAGVATAAGLVLGVDRLLAGSAVDPFAGGKLAGLVPFEDEQAGPAGKLTGSELDGRLFTDLSRVSADRLITPESEFFVRSAASRLLPDAAGWKIAFDGLVARISGIPLGEIKNAAKPMGVHLMECAGNVALTRFGLVSVGEWTGVPVADVLSEAKPKRGAAWVEIGGFDEYSEPSRTSTPGASWVFPVDALKNAFLATGLNGQPLNADHGAPVRLVVPGWYGCACIKWVNRVRFVEEGAEASSQMVEYAVRTLQNGRPRFARDYAPATVDAAALPVRVEKWIAGGKIRYRVVGLAWGGSVPASGLRIRFNPGDPYMPVGRFHLAKTDSWTVWNYTWSPAAPGDYTMRMAFADDSIRARKLDLGLYDRTVHTSEV
jgi:DMSO/TMAO reductase YedYZ molybdopterin-dependent catalytic subunit